MLEMVVGRSLYMYTCFVLVIDLVFIIILGNSSIKRFMQIIDCQVGPRIVFNKTILLNSSK